MGEIKRVLQSNENVNLKDEMDLPMIHVGVRVHGVCGMVAMRKHGFKLFTFRGAKGSIIRIRNKEEEDAVD